MFSDFVSPNSKGKKLFALFFFQDVQMFKMFISVLLIGNLYFLNFVYTINLTTDSFNGINATLLTQKHLP